MSNTQDKKPYVAPVSHRLIAGGVAGIAEILVMYPTDVIKTRAQLSVGANKAGFVTSLVELIKTEKFGVYRGIVPPILVEAPKRAIKFAANESYKTFFIDKQGKISRQGSAAAGVLAGITEAFVVVPFELVKIRLQDKNNKGMYKSTMDAVIKIAKAEGLLSFYKGLESTLWRHALWNGGYFGVIPIVQSSLPSATSEKAKLFNNFIAGGLAGTFGTILNTPADVVKSRIQNQVVKTGEVAKYQWAIPSMVQIAREEGVKALYKGFVPKVVRLGPGGGILLVAFEFVSKLLRQWSEK